MEDAKVGQYGTYGVEHNEEGDKLVLSATGMRLPEPDQVPDEERTFITTLSTETGSGTFKLVYNGVSLKVYPQDKEAEETVRAGDKTKNVSLSEKLSTWATQKWAWTSSTSKACTSTSTDLPETRAIKKLLSFQGRSFCFEERGL